MTVFKTVCHSICHGQCKTWRRLVGQSLRRIKWIPGGLRNCLKQRLVDVNRVGRFGVKPGMRPATVVNVKVMGQSLF